MLSRTIYSWLQRIGQPESFLDPKLKDLSDQSLILDREPVIKRIVKAIRSGESIICYGDYDVDGTGAACILTDCIRQCGGRVTTMLASRFNGGGYGFNDVSCDKVIALNADLLITLDCGSSDQDRLKRVGIDAIVVDHHLIPDKPFSSNVKGFLNPHQELCSSQYKWACSGGLALSVAGGILRELGIPKTQINPIQWIDLCALTTVCDVAPLTGDNRILTRYGLEAISKAERPGIRALLEINKIDIGHTWSGRDIGFRLGPALNAPGRLGPPDIIVDLLLSKDIGEARRIATSVKEIWDRRRVITDEVTEECIKEVDSNGYFNDTAIVLSNDSWGHGIVGISAARLVDKYKVPVCVIGHEGRGSLRGPPGSKLHSALTFCKEYLLKYGGHEAASGCQCAPESVESFRQKFCEFFQQNPPVKPEDQFDPILELDLEDNLLQVAKNIQLLEPCGQANPRPLIQTHGTVSQWKLVKGNHEKFDVLLPNNVLLPCFKINLTGEALPSLLNKQVTLQGDLRTNTWNGKTKAEMFVNNVIF